jgi:hypothetical protein
MDIIFFMHIQKMFIFVNKINMYMELTLFFSCAFKKWGHVERKKKIIVT